MKATGIVRRIDELGRVVIPKEIRRTLRIREGDPLELFTDRDELMLKKYSPIASIGRFSEGTAKSLNEQSGYLAAITDTDTVLSAYGANKRDLVGKTVSEKVTEIMNSRRSYLANKAEGGVVYDPVSGGEGEYTAEIIVPVVANGDCLGTVILLSREEGTEMEASAVKLARLTADILANQFE